MNVNFELYKVFYEVANEKSISKGAEKLMISQPAVTQAIHTLEDQLNGKLFIRTPKGVILTHEGEILYSYIKEGMSYFINGTNKFSGLRNLDSGVIKIGATTVISEEYLMPYLTKFHKEFPNIIINVVNDLTDNLIKELRNGNIDILVMAQSSTKIKDLDITELTMLHDIFVGDVSYKDKKFKSIEELLSEGLLLQKYPSVTRVNFNEYLKNMNLTCVPKMEVVSHSLLTSLVENGFGIGLLTKEFISDKINKSLYEIKIDGNIPSRKLVYAIKGGSIPTFTTSKFIEMLKEEN